MGTTRAVKQACRRCAIAVLMCLDFVPLHVDKKDGLTEGELTLPARRRRIIEFGQGDCIAEFIKDDAVHKRPHQKQPATRRLFNILLTGGVRHRCRIKAGTFIGDHHIAASRGYTVFDVNLFGLIPVVAMADGIMDCFFNGEL